MSLIKKTVSFLRSPVSVRSGGHSPSPGFASNNGRLLVDLGRLNQITLSGTGRVPASDQETGVVLSTMLWIHMVLLPLAPGCQLSALADRFLEAFMQNYGLGKTTSHTFRKGLHLPRC
jgi:hypothetical protein